MTTGRFAPSPTGPLHLGNLRTALIAWLAARSDGGRFVLRFEDLDGAVRPEHERSQLDDLRALGLDWDGEPIRQSDRLDRYRAAVDHLVAEDRVYPCWCSRRDIREAAQAPNGHRRTLRYPGTCAELDPAGRAAAAERTGRPPALRFRAVGRTRGFVDLVHGPFESELDDFVVQRGDGTPAYNLVAPLDDAETGVDLVVRADDLLDSTPRQLEVLDAIGHPIPRHAHVPLVLNGDGDRLAKRDGAVTLADRIALGESPIEVRSWLAASLGLCDADDRQSLDELLEGFDLADLPTTPWTLTNL